jgi:hypothetical protein
MRTVDGQVGDIESQLWVCHGHQLFTLKEDKELALIIKKVRRTEEIISIEHQATRAIRSKYQTH